MSNRPFSIKKTILVFVLVSASSLTGICQYYYKDLVTTKQINDNYRVLKENKVGKVTLISFQGNAPITDGFICEQTVNLARNQVITYTKTVDRGESFFTANYNAAGLLIKTTDSSLESVSISTYQYDTGNRLLQLSHTTRATDNSSSISELHAWEYSTTGKPKKMLRIKNSVDTTIVNFSLDEKGNVAEEQALHKNVAAGKIYYYYDEKNLLTDVVRYNAKAKRLLPDYIFEYEENGELATMTIVPEGSSDYQKWYYKYDDTGLKMIEFCYNKKAELLGKVEYNYSVGK